MWNVTVGPIHCSLNFKRSLYREGLTFVLLNMNIIFILSVTPIRRSQYSEYTAIPIKQCQCPANQMQVTSGKNKHVNIGWEGGGRSGIRDKEKLASRKTTN